MGKTKSRLLKHVKGLILVVLSYSRTSLKNEFQTLSTLGYLFDHQLDGT